MPPSLVSFYPKKSDRFDEMLAEDGSVRPSWQSFVTQLDAATPEQMRHRLDYVRRRILENGVTYNVYADPKGADRPWELDPLPLILSPGEWQKLSAAVTQRARLLNAVLQDLYGPQTLLHDGSLPPALIFGHKNYLWPCRGLRPPGDIHLHFYAADLARSPDGRWWVIADRTQAPSGAGYALENRTIVGRVFPEQFRDLHVQHLASFFRDLQDSLAYWAPTTGETALVVLLTPGPYNETYFEHAYLARYLGYPLVEGHDLTVRGERVYLRTLSGLRRVHAILRRLDDDFCDPLELRSDSALGVPGLLQAVRAGNVLVANALGSGLLESPALPGFLPAISERLLGEKLLMPSVATWWCGERTALEFTIEHLDDLVIKGSYPSQRFDPLFGNELKGSQRQEMIARLRARPQAYVAQELVNFSQAPAWHESHERALLPRGVGLRVFVAATPAGHVVMPGGLTRVAAVSNARIISMQRGGSSKDTWVLTEQAVNTFSLLKHSVGKADLVRGGRNLSSRVVESLYWFGRYAERCDKTSRVLRVALARLIDAGGDAQNALGAVCDLARILQVLPTADQASGKVDAAEPPPSREAELLRAVCSQEWGEGLAGDIRRLLWVATQVRERFSLDNWHAINRLQQRLQRYGAAGESLPLAPSDALAFLDEVLLTSSSLAGFAMDNMTRDDGWRFLIIGRRIERLMFLANMVAGFLRLESTRAAGSLEWLLELSDSIITYRSRYMTQPQVLPTIDLIVFDEGNPHSVSFQLQILVRYLDNLSRLLGGPHDESMRSARAALQGFDLGRFEGLSFSQCRVCDPCLDLALLLGDISLAAAALSDRLEMRFFSHVGDVSRQTFAS
ncbi:circularly permuted type 2 ATP-grasp protein [Accumulibacter sp.]|uniref:circularly permuted type 2 ATP-grasp protein n=1 Tax=Accumulibacter sp. TaxID=2053492 RepID=UPI0025CB9A92|nr:circularly permuted type 2 ATP-grasp protein [Accumulibacter sp.]MCM8614210.1 circularly permuted type 2 ATP-grasp protein [Accumulibacter sp.]MCM8638021.1 circularly permuted type 2 ATP-grasp protein [Accumulibacter sp.]MCM8641335.1 circularly permuted type 2 ATP-grasp protein [Accumulibacter sp.]